MRRELKYEISYQEYQNIMRVLDRVLKRDKHSNEDGEYQIKTIYFDNHLHEIENDKKNDINSVKKYRIRMYNNNENSIFLERKSNENIYKQKVKQKIKKQDVINILNGDYKEILEAEESLKTELYFKLLLKQYRPTIIIEYTRTAYRDEASKVGITIDKNIKSTKDCKKFFEDVQAEESKKYILEVKYDKEIPQYIKNIIMSLENKKVAKAKFITQIKKFNIKG